MIACASRSRQCADARCALASTHDAAKAMRKQQAGKQASGQASTQARCMCAEVGVERTTGVVEGRICDALPASGVTEGCRGKGADPLVLRSGLPPNRAATAYRPDGGCLSLFPFLIPVSLLLFLETAGIGVLWACWHQYLSIRLSLLHSTHERIERRYVKLVKNERIGARDSVYLTDVYDRQISWNTRE